MFLLIEREFRFESSHNLIFLPIGHKCRRLHGHNYIISLSFYNKVNVRSRFILDYHYIKIKINYLLKKVDHMHLNDIEGLGNPTSENLSIWFLKKMMIYFYCINSIVVSETCFSRCVLHRKTIYFVTQFSV